VILEQSQHKLTTMKLTVIHKRLLRLINLFCVKFRKIKANFLISLGVVAERKSKRKYKKKESRLCLAERE